MSPVNKGNDAPFFIVGSGRSGTTLLRIILASHTRLSIPPETWFLNRLTDLLEIERPLTPAEIEKVVRTIVGHYRWPDFGIDADAFRRDVGALQTPQLRDIVELIYRAQLRRDGKARWGDKTPGYIELIPQLVRLFPGARFIHFIRDGRDVAKSFQARRWNGKWLHANCREWIEAMQWDRRWRDTEFADRILRVRYEDLVLDMEPTVRLICSFLDEEFEPNMLAWNARIDGLVPAREAHIHEKLKRPPSARDIYRWKREMSSREILVAEAFMGPYLKAQGYELRFGRKFWAPLLYAARLYCLWLIPVVDVLLKPMRFVRRQFTGTPPQCAASADAEL